MTPTILIFLKAPVPGRAKTRLAKGVGAAEAIRIYGELVQRQLAALPAGWPVEVHFAPPEEETAMRAWLGEAVGRTFWPQGEGHLGERLTRAMVGAFARGAEGVMAIGGDCPGLTEARLREAAQAMVETDLVMGPTMDGGYYLLGMVRPCGAVFEHEEWGTPTVAATTRRIVRERGWRLKELAPLRDVDDIDDWAAVQPLD